MADAAGWRFAGGERIVPTALGDVERVAALLRDADRDEVWASRALDPLTALQMSVRQTPEPWTIWKGEEPAAVFGVVPVSAVFRSGLVWLLGTDLIERHPIPFLRHSREVMADLRTRGGYRVLFNWVDDRNALSRRWLRWCGFRENGFVNGMFGDRFTLFELGR